LKIFWLKKVEEVLIYAALERVFTSCLPNFRTTETNYHYGEQLT